MEGERHENLTEEHRLESLLDSVDKIRQYVLDQKDKTLILFADLADSTKYKEQKDIIHGVDKIRRHNIKATEVILRHKGKIVKYIGDAVMARFDSPVLPHEAVNAAIEIQEVFSDINSNLVDELEKIKSKIGIAIGKVVDFYDHDPHGLAVDIAARLTSWAKPEQILVTRELRDDCVVSKVTSRCAKAHMVHEIICESVKRKLSGIRDEVEMCEVVWGDKPLEVGEPQEDVQRRIQDLEMKLEAAEEASRSIPRLIEKEAWGYEIGMFKKVAKIGMDGSISQTTENHGVRAINQGIHQFAHRISTSDPEGYIGEPELGNLHIAQGFGKGIALRILRHTATECDFILTVAGGLSPQDGGLDYSYHADITKAVCMTKEQAAELYKDEPFQFEYACVNITCPTELAELEVEFPEGYHVEPYMTVFTGQSETVNEFELKRREEQECFEKLPSGARFRIEKPLTGFRYGIYWTPISEKEYNRLQRA